MSTSQVLYDYTGANLDDFIQSKRSSMTVVQILPVSDFRSNEHTGVDSRDYLLVYEKVGIDKPHAPLV